MHQPRTALLLIYCADITVEAKSVPANGLDVCVSVVTVTQSLSQHRDVMIQVALFHKRVWPELLDQIVFLQYAPAVLHQHDQRVESLRRERNGLAIAQQLALGRYEPERIEFV